MTDNATHFYSYLAEGNIICRCKARTGAEVISELARLLARNNAGLSAESIVSEVLAREAVFPTVIAPCRAHGWPSSTSRSSRWPPAGTESISRRRRRVRSKSSSCC